MRVFISYSHDTTEHEQRVRAVADQLRADGVDAWIDQYVQDPDEGWIKWMRTQVREAEKVLLVFTETYQRRFEGDEEEGKGLGATFEGVIVTQSLYESGGRNAKFRPVVFRDEDAQFIPVELRKFNRYRVDTPEHYQNLLRWLYNEPLITPPTLGQKANLAPQPGPELFASKSVQLAVSVPASPLRSAQGLASQQPPLLGISKTTKTVEGVLTFGRGSWRMSVLLPPFLDKPKITLVPEGWSAHEDPVIEELTTDKFTAKISSSTQEGKWRWRANGALLKTQSADAATTSGIGTIEGALTFARGSWRMSALLPPFLDKPKITLVPEGWSAHEDPVIEEITTDKFTAKISSSTQEGEWIWRARGPRREGDAGPPVGPSHSITAPSAAGLSIPATSYSRPPVPDSAVHDREMPVEHSAEQTSGNGTLRIVLIMHGIRDEGGWMPSLRRLIEKETNAKVAPLNPDRISLTWFLLGARYLGYVKKFRDLVAQVLSNYKEAEVIFIAHSYGTWCLADVIQNWSYRESVKPVRIVLCGSVLPQDNPWGEMWNRVYRRYRDDKDLPWVWNDIGGSDPFPLLARLVSKDYGDAGVSRFTEPIPDLVVNRVHAGLDHGGCFIKTDLTDAKVINEEFIRKFWLPIIRCEDAPRYGDNERTDPGILRLSYWVKTLPEVRNWVTVIEVVAWSLLWFGRSELILTAGRFLAASGAAIAILWLWNGFNEVPSGKKRSLIGFASALFAILLLLAVLAWVAAPLLTVISSHTNAAPSPTPISLLTPTPTAMPGQQPRTGAPTATPIAQNGSDYNPSNYVETWKTELLRRQNENGAFRITSDPTAAPQAWTSAQCLVGLLSNSALVVPNSKSILKGFDFLETARSNDKQGGWGMWDQSQFPIVEITAWANLAYIFSMREEVADAIWSGNQQAEIVKRIKRDLDCNLQLQDSSGGWPPIEGVPLEEARTYSTTMVLWSELSAISTPRFKRFVDDSRYRTWIFRALYWFQRSFRLELDGWVPKPSRLRQYRRFPGLSAQIIYVLALAQRDPQFAFIHNWNDFKNAKHLFLTNLTTNPVGIASVPNDQIETVDQAVPPVLELEGSTFLAFPWTLKACQILKTDASLSDSDKNRAAEVESRLQALLPEWNDRLLNETTESFEIAESLAALVSDP